MLGGGHIASTRPPITTSEIAILDFSPAPYWGSVGRMNCRGLFVFLKIAVKRNLGILKDKNSFKNKLLWLLRCKPVLIYWRVKVLAVHSGYPRDLNVIIDSFIYC